MNTWQFLAHFLFSDNTIRDLDIKQKDKHFLHWKKTIILVYEELSKDDHKKNAQKQVVFMVQTSSLE